MKIEFISPSITTNLNNGQVGYSLSPKSIDNKVTNELLSPSSSQQDDVLSQLDKDLIFEGIIYNILSIE